MKRVVLLFAMILPAGFSVWGQTPPPGSTPPGVTPPPGVPAVSPPAGAGFFGTSGSVNFNAVPRLSTSLRFSAGTFVTDADNFINPRFFNPAIGTFLFAGGELATDRGAAGENSFGIGFARSFDAFYLAALYRGSLLEAEGRGNDEWSPGSLPSANWREAEWDSSFAVLLGLANMGFRFDLIVDSVTRRRDIDYSGVSSDGELLRESIRRLTGGPALSMTWGADFGNLLPWARVGYRFADSYLLEREGEGFGFSERFTANAALEAAVGARFLLGGTSAVGAEFRFASTFSDREEYLGTLPPGTPGSPEPDFSNRRFGMLGYMLGVYYQQRFEIDTAAGGNWAFGLRPRLNAGLTERSNDWVGGSFTWAQPWDRWFTLSGAFDLGLRVRPAESRFAFFAGLEVRLFDWTTWEQTRGDDSHPARGSAWRVQGARVQDLNIGMTFDPVENITIGLGLTEILNSGFFINGIPGIDLTVSARFAPRTAAASVPPAPAPVAEEGVTE